MSEDYIKLLVDKIDGIQKGVNEIETQVARLDQKFVDHEDVAARLAQEIESLKKDANELRGRVLTLEQVRSNAMSVYKVAAAIGGGIVALAGLYSHFVR